MFKTYSKINSTKTLLIAIIAFGFVILILNLFIVIANIISLKKPQEEIANPAIIQQQNIQKAYQLINDQTIQD